MSANAARIDDTYAELFNDIPTESDLVRTLAVSHLRQHAAHGAHATREVHPLLTPTLLQRWKYWAWHPVSRMALAVATLAVVVVLALHLASQVTIGRLPPPQPSSPVVTVTMSPTTTPQRQTVTAPLQIITVTQAPPLSQHP